MTVATGRKWLETFETEAGNVLVLDNELHPETTANGIPKIALARDIPMATIAETVFVDNLRGRLQDIFSLAPYFNALQPGWPTGLAPYGYVNMPDDRDEPVKPYPEKSKTVIRIFDLYSSGGMTFKLLIDQLEREWHVYCKC